MARPKKSTRPETPWPTSRVERVTNLAEPVEIYSHDRGHAGYGVRVDLDGGDRYDADHRDYCEIARATTEAILRRQRRGNPKGPARLTLVFVVRDRRTGFGVKPEDVKEIDRLRVTAIATTVEKVD